MSAAEALMWFLVVDAVLSIVAYHVSPWFRELTDAALDALRRLFDGE